MKTQILVTLSIIAAIATLSSCATQPTTTRVPISGAIRSDPSASGKLYDAVNQYRSSLGKSQVQRHAGLDSLARKHSEYLRQNRGSFGLYGKNVSHFGFEGRATYAMRAFNMQSVSENVAYSSRPGAANILSLWVNSKDHDYNMKASWTHTGVGVVVDSDGTVFATQLFGTMNYSQMTTRNRFNSY